MPLIGGRLQGGNVMREDDDGTLRLSLRDQCDLCIEPGYITPVRLVMVVNLPVFDPGEIRDKHFDRLRLAL